MAESNKAMEIIRELRRCEKQKIVFNMHNKFTLQEIEKACDLIEQADKKIEQQQEMISELVKIANKFTRAPFNYYVWQDLLGDFKAAIAKAEEFLK